MGGFSPYHERVRLEVMLTQLSIASLVVQPPEDTEAKSTGIGQNRRWNRTYLVSVIEDRSPLMRVLHPNLACFSRLANPISRIDECQIRVTSCPRSSSPAMFSNDVSQVRRIRLPILAAALPCS